MEVLCAEHYLLQKTPISEKKEQIVVWKQMVHTGMRYLTPKNATTLTEPIMQSKHFFKAMLLVSTYCRFFIYQNVFVFVHHNHRCVYLFVAVCIPVFSLSQALCPCTCVSVCLCVLSVYLCPCPCSSLCLSLFVLGKIQSYLLMVPDSNSRFTCWLTWLIPCKQQTFCCDAYACISINC